MVRLPAKLGPDPTTLRTTFPNSGPIPASASLGTMPTSYSPIAAKLSLESAKIRAKADEYGPISAWEWADSGRFGYLSSELGQTWPEFGQPCPEFG